MEWRMVWTTFFLLMALTTTVSYLWHENGYALIIAVSMNLVATTLKLGARRMIGAMMMATSLVADFHLVPAVAAFFLFARPELATSLVWGALAANLVGIVLLIIEAVLRQLELEELS